MPNGYVFTQSAFDSTYGVSTGDVIGAGVMSPEAGDHFIDSLFDLTTLKSRAQVLNMGSPTRRITRASFGRRLLRPGASGVAPSFYSQMGVSEVALNAQLMKAVVKINDEELEDNLTKGDLTNYVIGKIQTQIANEIEYACLMGQKTGLVGSAVYIDHQVDGWYYLAKQSGHVVDGSALADAGYLLGGAAGDNTRHYTKKKASVAARSIPARYKTQQKGFTHFVSPGVYEEMIDTFADRPNTGANQAYEANGLEPHFPQGLNSRMGYSAYPFVIAPLLPEGLFLPNATATTTVSAGGAVGTNTFTPASATNVVAGATVQIGDPTTPNAETAIVQSVVGGVATVYCPDTADGNFAFGHAGHTVHFGSNDRTFMFTTYPTNLIVGMYREIRIEPTRWGPESATYFTVSLRMDVQLELPDAVAIVDNMTAVID